MDNSHWNQWFLTPSTTPTDATFSPTALQTPRTSTHFSDAFSPYIQQNTTSTPFMNSEHVDRRVFSQDSLHNQMDGNTAAQYNNQQQSQFGQFGMTNGQHFGQSNKQSQSTAFHNLQQSNAVQTPPPTRNPSEKRRAPRPHSIMFGTPTSMDQVMGGQSLVDHSQNMLPHSISQPVLPMAMDFSQFNSAVSSNMPQDDTYWNLPNSMSMNDLSQQNTSNGLADPFTYQAQTNSINGHTVPSNDQPQFLSATPQLFTPVQPAPVQRAPVVPSNAQKPLPPIPTEGGPNMMRTGAGVDPTILYSSPNRMPPPPQPLVPSIQPITHADSLSPEKIPQMAFASPAANLASQRLSFQSEQDLSRPPSSGGLKPGLRRSNTTETRRPHSMYGSIESLSRSNTTAGIQRRASPLKRYNRNSTTSLASISESASSLPRSRTSVVLTVDSKGRARAEKRTVDPSPTKQMMSRYPNLFLDSDDDSDSDDTPNTTNNRHSFCAPSSSDRHSRAEKIDSALESLEGLHLPRSSSSASNRVTPSKAAVAAAAQLRRQSSVKKSYHHNRRSTAASSTGSFMEDGDAMDTGSDTDTAGGNAAAALRKAIDRRDQQRESAAAARQQARSRPQSQSQPASVYPPRSSSLANLGPPTQAFDCAPMMQAFSSPQKHHHQQQHQHHQHSHLSQPSPMKPTGSFADAMSSITRCICHLPIAEGQLMIQCNSCQMWLHTACLGIPPTNLPPTYFCTFCMAPAAQAGRVSWETTAAF